MKGVENLLESLAKVEERRPKTVLALFMVFTLITMLGFGMLKTSTSNESQVPQDIASIEALNQVRDKLGTSTDSVILIFRPDVDDPKYVKDMRDKDVIRSISIITKQIEKDDFVLSSRSIADIANLNMDQNEINIMIASSPLSQGLLSSDYTITIATLTIGNGINQVQQRQLLGNIDEIVRLSEKPAGLKVDVAGSLALSRELGVTIGRNTGLVTALGFVGVIIVLFVFFRKVSFVGVTTLPILLGTIWTLGTLGLIGIQLSTILTGVFSIIIGLGIDFGIHIIHRFEEDKKIYGVEKGIYNAVKHVGKGLTLTTITTVIGFLALLFATLPLLQDFSISLSLGVFYSLLAAIGVIPPVLVLIERRKERKAKGKK